MIDVEAYLARIGYSGSLEPTAATLRGLQRAHLLSVPFENLDIGRGRPIVIDEAAFVRKVVDERRGGFCYELNGAFAALLRSLGYQVTLISAGVSRDDGGFGPEFDHLALLVEAEGRRLVDVGFGDAFIDPLLLDDPGAQPAERPQADWDRRAFRLLNDGEVWVLQRRDGAEEWKNQYRFTLQPRRLDDFAGMCRFHQTSPESSFTRRRVCSLATAEGRVTLSEMRLIVTSRGEREERTLESEADCLAALREHFGITL